ncbi:Hsp20/alpha crystallin family protein, partial [Streptomyces sp. NPDC056683]|uniref:Hsp20/alpha crystallin family protein n=1 Tax=Streptomyces sp. NPDC056683 TaxID=3345910 RepID=UPI00367F924A
MTIRKEQAQERHDRAAARPAGAARGPVRLARGPASPFETEEKHRTGFRYGAFTRSVGCPPEANGDEAAAEYTDGVLNVQVPVPVPEEKTGTGTIPVRTGRPSGGREPIPHQVCAAGAHRPRTQQRPAAPGRVAATVPWARGPTSGVVTRG